MYLETADIETASEGYASRFRGAAGEYFLARQADITLEFLRDLPGAKVLEVGGGHAQLAEPLVKNGYRVTITGSDDCVYLIYRDGALISTRVKDAGFTGNQANITWSNITEADSGTYTVRAYNSYAGLSEPSNAVTFTYQA